MKADGGYRFEAGAINNHLARSLAAACEVLFGALLKTRYMVLCQQTAVGKDKVPQMLRTSRCKDMIIRGLRKQAFCTLGSIHRWQILIARLRRPS